MIALSSAERADEVRSEGRLLTCLSHVWREQRLLLGIVVVYSVIIAVAEWRLGLPVPLGNVGFGNFYFLFGLAVLCYFAGALLWTRTRVRDANGRWISSWRAWSLAWMECRRGCFTLYRLATAAVVSCSILVLLRTYSSWKPLIPLIRPYGELDVRLMQLDRWVHLGYDPWRLLQPWLGHPSITLGVDLLYALWLPLNFSVVLWQAALPDTRVRNRFFISYALLWIVVGTGTATAFASVGPCYYGRIVAGLDPFQPLMAYLGQIHADSGLIALRIQENLWAYYLGREVLPLNGISAMPSLHVAGATLFALAGWRAGRRLGLSLSLYAVVVMLGSVHLGWHYALDGYVGAVAAAGIWWVAGPRRASERASDRARGSPTYGSGRDQPLGGEAGR